MFISYITIKLLPISDYIKDFKVINKVPCSFPLLIINGTSIIPTGTSLISPPTG